MSIRVRTQGVQNFVSLATRIRYVHTGGSGSEHDNVPVWARKIADSISPPLPLTKTEEEQLAEVLKNAMEKKIDKKTVDTSFANHFQSLFKGIEAISQNKNDMADATDDQRLAYIRKLKSETRAIELFDFLYYSGRLSFRVALSILRSPVIKDIQHLVVLFNSGGTLFKWTPTERHAFRMQIANKYNVLGDRSRAEELIVGWFDNWLRLAHAGELNRKTLMALGSALIAFGREDYFLQLLQTTDVESTVKSAVPLYRVSLSAGKISLARKITDLILATKDGEKLLRKPKYSVMLLASFMHVAREHNLKVESYCASLLSLGKKPNWALSVPMAVLTICEDLCKETGFHEFVLDVVLPRAERCAKALFDSGILEASDKSLLRAKLALVTELCALHGPNLPFQVFE